MANTTSTSTSDKQELRKFGLVIAAGLVLIFGLFLPWQAEKPWPGWPWMVASVFAGTALVLPQALKPLFWLWMKIGHVLGWINTRIILGVIFFILFAPIALVLHLLGKDFMKRRMDASAITYRMESEKLPRERLEKPY
ncbi:MAG: sxtJ [Candidatus Sungbacteria bacterium]|uniref:SxtJ n=1 Tax=Candidatus Sungiibacteriota bacterium TaxID=2750080 RepID=A0A932R254_9BACT|nr:sxtJ [Candidatus Sungbacteria bacterium]